MKLLGIGSKILIARSEFERDERSMSGGTLPLALVRTWYRTIDIMGIPTSINVNIAKFGYLHKGVGRFLLIFKT